MSTVTRTILASLVVLVSSPTLIAQPKPTTMSQARLRLGYVKNGDIGCGCSFARNQTDLRKRRYIYSESMDEPAYINVNGNNLKLYPVASSETDGAEKVGQQSWETFTAGNLKIRLEKIVTKICDPNDESCEVTYYEARIIVNSKRQKISEPLIGLCGC